MDRDNRETEEGGKGKAAPTNVVQFPRDWLGPREELIPFGPRASQSANEPSGTPSASSLSPSEVPVSPNEPSLPASASDFWGEHSADMHHVLQGPERMAPKPTAPDVPAVESTPSPPAPGRSHPGRRRRPVREVGRGWRRWAERPAAASRSPGGASKAASVRRARTQWSVRSPGRLGRDHLGWPSLRRGQVALLGVLACLVIAVASVLVSGRSSPARSDAATGVPLPVARLRGDLLTWQLTLPTGLVTRVRPAARRAVSRLAQGHFRRGGHRGRPALGGTPVRVINTASSGGAGPSGGASSGLGSSGGVDTSGVAGSGTSASGSGSASTVSVDSGSGGSGTNTGGAVTSGSGSTSAGPTGAGAPFGPGHLG